MARCTARWGRRAIAWALAALLLAGALGLCLAARAEDAGTQLRIEAEVRPEGLLEPGDVTIHFTLKNVSGRDAKNVYLASADGLVFEQVGLIAPGEERSFSREHSVTEAELEAEEIFYSVTHDDPDDANRKINYGVHARILHSASQPDVEFTRQFSSRSVAAGSTLTVTYHLRNTGNVPLTELEVRDELGSFTGRVESLDVGESRALVNRAVATGPATSVARLSFRAEGGGEAQTRSLEDVVIGLAESGLESQFSVDYSAFSSTSANAVLTLRNGGNVDYCDLCVLDETYGGVIADGLSLSAGGTPLEISRTYHLRGDAGFQWRVTGRSAAGEAVDLLTEPISLPRRTEGELSALRLTAQALTPRIRREGDVTLRVNIENPGGVELRDLVLSEDELGDVHSFAVLSANGAITRDFTMHVSDDTSFVFSLRGTAAGGETARAYASPVEVVIASDGAMPEGAQERFFEFSGGSIKIGGSSTFAVLLIAGCAALLILIVALIVATHRARLERQLRAAEERKRRREELGKTNRFTPVRAPQTRKRRRRERKG